MTRRTRARAYAARWYAMRRNGYSGPFFVALSLFFMGVWVLVVPEVFDSSPAYRVMADVGSQIIWGALLLMTSLLMLVSSVNRRPREVAIGALAAAMGYFLMFSSVLAGNPRSMFVPLLLVMVLRCLSINREFNAAQDDPHLSG